MSIETEATEAEQPVKRGRGRPPKRKTPLDNKVTRETRVPMGGFRDILTVQNKDPNYHYALPLDLDENGSQIARFIQAGYEFVRPEEGAMVGEASVYTTENLGSVHRIPAGGGYFHYLMKLPMEFYEDDLKADASKVDRTEQALKGLTEKEGFYGSFNMERN